MRLVVVICILFVCACANPRARVAVVHFNPELGQIEENIQRLTVLVGDAMSSGADIVVTPELATTGFSITESQVAGDLGLRHPFPELQSIEQLAKLHDGYVFVGIAEQHADGRARNSVVAYGPDGLVGVQHKRGESGWHARGEKEILVFGTRFGDIAPVICSDTYLPDVARLAALRGADIVVAPTNWWGESDQLRIWKVRARQNGVWMIVANRWGREVDLRGATPCSSSTQCTDGRKCRDSHCVYDPYNMNDGPSAVISDKGEVAVTHRTIDQSDPRDTIIYSDVRVSRKRAQSTENRTWTVASRQPSAYQALANEYYLPDSATTPQDLPEFAEVRATAMAVADNCKGQCVIQALDSLPDIHKNLVVIPPDVLNHEPVDFSGDWDEGAVWAELRKTVARHELQVVVTSATGIDNARRLIAVFPQEVQTRKGIHDTQGSGSLWITDTSNHRIAIVQGTDILFPEVATSAAKAGVDVILVPSNVIGRDHVDGLGQWRGEDLSDAINVAALNAIDIVAADTSGLAEIINDNGGWISSSAVKQADENGTSAAQLLLSAPESGSRPFRKLNYYYDFDLEVLLGCDQHEGKSCQE